MKKITRVVETSIFVENITFKEKGKTHKFLKVSYETNMNNTELIHLKGLPNNFKSLTDNEKVNSVFNVKAEFRYVVAKKEYLEELPSFMEASQELYDSFNNANNFEDITEESVLSAFNEGRIININHYGWNHLISVYGEHAPIFTKRKLGYIGTPLANDYIKWDNKDKLIEHLKNNPCVISIEEESIPYYNAEKNKNKFLEVVIEIDKETRESLWKEIKQLNLKEPASYFRKVLTLDGLGYNPDMLDFLKIRPFLRNKKEIEALRDY